MVILCAMSLTILSGHQSCIPHTHQPPPNGPPAQNIVLILTDDQRWDTIQYMPTVMTELAGKGTTFNNSYVSVPSCCPSRASVYSGQWGHNTGVVFNSDSNNVSDAPGFDLPNGGATAFDETTCIGVALQNEGYRTGLFGKYMNDEFLRAGPGPALSVPLGWDDYRAYLDNGFNFFDYRTNENGTEVLYGSDPEDYSTDVARDQSLAFLDSIDVENNEPFFLVFAPYAPHFDNGFYRTTPAPRHDGEALANGVTFDIPVSYDEPDITDKPEWLQNAQASVMDSAAGVEANIDSFRYETVDSLQAVDEAIFDILAKLDEMGVSENTMVIFTSDNGYLWGEHRLGQKLAMYEESVRVPLVIRYPKVHPVEFPTEVDYLVSNVDLAPTMAEIAGSTGGDYDGDSLIPVLDLTVTSWRTHLLVETWLAESLVPNILIPGLFPLMPDAASVRNDQFKYVDYATGTDELYDLINDPLELDNLINDPTYAAELAALQAELAILLAD